MNEHVSDGNESWLLPDHTDRARMVDMDRRLAPVRRAALAVLVVALILSGPWIGWWTLIPLAIAAVLFSAADRMVETRERPEYWVFGAWVGSEVMIAVAVLLTGAPDVPSMAWFAIPVVTLSARFSFRGICLGVAITLALLAAVALGSDAGAVIDDPTLLIMPVALILAVAILSTALMRSEMDHRIESVIDPLTGLLNRKALRHRVDELRQQSTEIRAPIGVIFADLDHFKRVNDTIGHAGGDEVLRQVAEIIKGRLRAFELAYRVGGEEFLILLPGADIDQAVELADQLRVAISEGELYGGGTVTLSCGVAVSDAGEEFDFDLILRRADDALYEAKRAGRDRVVPEPLVAA